MVDGGDRQVIGLLNMCPTGSTPFRKGGTTDCRRFGLLLQFPGSVLCDIGHGLCYLVSNYPPVNHTHTSPTHVDGLFLLGGKIAPINAPPHVLHDHIPSPSIDEDDVPQPREFGLVLLIQGCQLLRFLLRTGLQLCLLCGALGAVDLFRSQPRVRAQNGQERLPRGGVGVDSVCNHEELAADGLDELGVGRKSDAAKGRAGERVQLVAGLKEEIQNGAERFLGEGREGCDVWECRCHCLVCKVILTNPRNLLVKGHIITQRATDNEAITSHGPDSVGAACKRQGLLPTFIWGPLRYKPGGTVRVACRPESRDLQNMQKLSLAASSNFHTVKTSAPATDQPFPIKMLCASTSVPRFTSANMSMLTEIQ